MTDLNLDGLPVLNGLWNLQPLPQFKDRREQLRAELRQLVERERKEAFEAACAEEQRLPAWAKPALLALLKVSEDADVSTLLALGECLAKHREEIERE